MNKIFEVHQKLTFMVNEYVILRDTPAGQKTVGYAKQKRFAMREQFHLFSDETKSEVIATSKARSVMDLAPTFDILDGKGRPLAVMKKAFKKSLL